MTSQLPEGNIGGMARDFAERLQELVERIGAVAKSGSSDLAGQWGSLLESSAAMSSMPLRQTQIMVDAIRAHRDQLRALQEQLNVFDQQLTALDDALRPMLEWGQQLSQTQDKMLGLARRATTR